MLPEPFDESILRGDRLGLCGVTGTCIRRRRYGRRIGRVLHGALMQEPVGSLGGEAHRSGKDRHGEGDDQRHHASLIAKKSAQARLCSLRRYEKVPRAKLRRPGPQGNRP